MKTLPKMGRPCITGLSIKELGEKEYKRRYRALKSNRKTFRPIWTGIAPRKQIGMSEYMKKYRSKLKERNTQ